MSHKQISPTRSAAFAGIHLCLLMMLTSSFCPAIESDSLSSEVVEKALAGPLKNIEEIIFVTRTPYVDSHWYANFGYYGNDETDYCFPGKGEGDKSRLCKLNLRSGRVTTILDAKGGSIRDPQVHYDAKKILFSYRMAGTLQYHLFEINVDGTGLRQLTFGQYDDIEPSYLPDGGIVFVSSRSRQWTGCLPVQVGTIYRCDGNGNNITRLSANIEHDNTPWVLPDGRIMYTRWEYIDRNWLYHGLWTMNPDGTGQMVYYGNMHAKIVMIDAKPIPGTHRVVASFNENHGKPAHYGQIATVTGEYGPDDNSSVHVFQGQLTNDPYLEVNKGVLAHDPYPISEDCYLLADKHRILVMNGQGSCGQLYASPANTGIPNPVTEDWIQASSYRNKFFAKRYLVMHYSFPHFDDIHEPRPLVPRQREPILQNRTDSTAATGRMLLLDVYKSRNLEGVKNGEIKKLLILEALPKPVGLTNEQDLVSFGGTHTLERVLGTVPVEADGSAHFELPAKRPVFFVALDENDMSVKRMQSFTTVMPGENLSCVGCHEKRTETPGDLLAEGVPLAFKREASQIQPFNGYPDVLDFQRDVQPILDKHCIRCHNYDEREGSVVLTGDLGTDWSHSYFTLIARLQVADGRHGLGNQPPRSLGSSASPLLDKLRGGHNEVQATEEEWRMVWLWIESAAPYAGSYTAIRNLEDQERAATALELVKGADAMQQLCVRCHKPKSPLEMPYDHWRNTRWLERDKPLIKSLDRPLGPNERVIIPNDPITRFGPALLYNFTRPEKSHILLAPLSKEAGGWGICPDVYEDKNDPMYRDQLARICEAKSLLETNPRYGTAGFKPNHQYLRELRKYGFDPKDIELDGNNDDIFELDEWYWRSLHWNPDSQVAEDQNALSSM